MLVSTSNNEDLKKWFAEIYVKQIEIMLEDFDYMLTFKSLYEIDKEKRVLINTMIDKFAARKTHAL